MPWKLLNYLATLWRSLNKSIGVSFGETLNRNRDCTQSPWRPFVKPKQSGRLGFKHLTIMNKALLAKLCWRMVTNPNRIWAEVLWCKYGSPFHLTPPTYGAASDLEERLKCTWHKVWHHQERLMLWRKFKFKRFITLIMCSTHLISQLGIKSGIWRDFRALTCFYGW